MPFTRRTPAAGLALATTSTSTATPSTPSSTTSTTTTVSPSSTPSPSLPRIPLGCRPAPSGGPALLPSGIPSLDDVLGGGLPLGSVLLLLGPDEHTTWPLVVARHWVGQGLVSGQKGVVLSSAYEAERTVKGAPWIERAAGSAGGSESEGEENVGQGRGGKRIAWRYDGMKKFQTTVGGSGLASNTTIPSSILTDLLDSQRLVYFPIQPPLPPSPILDGPLLTSSPARDRTRWTPPMSNDPVDIPSVLARLEEHVREATEGGEVVRITVPDLGGIEWGVLSDPEIIRVLRGIREIVRSHSSSSAVVTLPPTLSRPFDRIKRLAWCVDGCIELVGFGSDPSLAAHFHPAHGLLHLHSFPQSHHLLPPSIRFSALLGLASTGAGGGGGAAENNLGFRMKRKRFVVETVHLGIEGGTSERRTEPVVDTASVLAAGPGPGVGVGVGPMEGIEKAQGVKKVENEEDKGNGVKGEAKKVKKERTRVRFGDDLEVAVGDDAGHGHSHEHEHKHDASHTPRVAIRHDRPDLYEF